MPKMSYEAIQKQIAKLQTQAKALEAARSARKTRAVAQVRALMRKLGVEMADLAAAGAGRGRAEKAPRATRKSGAKSGGNRAKVAPKYRDPETGSTWTGRGRTPVWLAGKIATGRAREEFAISAGDAK